MGMFVQNLPKTIIFHMCDVWNTTYTYNNIFIIFRFATTNIPTLIIIIILSKENVSLYFERSSSKEKQKLKLHAQHI